MFPTLSRCRFFAPRLTFPVSESIPRSHYLGHHEVALQDIKSHLPEIGLVIECRDYRFPISSWNPILDRTVADRQRIIVYTHQDLGIDSPPELKQDLLNLHEKRASPGPPPRVFFWRKDNWEHTKQLTYHIRDVAMGMNSVTGLHALVMGMPNTGKSSLVNRLRKCGTRHRRHSRKSGTNAGVTRTMSGALRILEKESKEGFPGIGEGVFAYDTPGIFLPYVADPEMMVKLALAGYVKDNYVPKEIVADYLLYRLNLIDPSIYARYSSPTNDVSEFLEGIAGRSGKLKPDAEPNLKAAADWIITRWRRGKLGKFVMDDINDAAFEAKEREREGEGPVSMNQARKMEKEARKEEALN